MDATDQQENNAGKSQDEDSMPDLSSFDIQIFPPEIEDLQDKICREKRQIGYLKFLKNCKSEITAIFLKKKLIFLIFFQSFSDFSQHLIKMEKSKLENKEKIEERQLKLVQQMEKKREIIKKFDENAFAQLDKFLEMPKLVKDSKTTIALKKLMKEREDTYMERKAEFERIEKLIDQNQPSEELKQKSELNTPKYFLINFSNLYFCSVERCKELREQNKIKEENLKALKEEEQQWKDKIAAKMQAHNEILAEKKEKLKKAVDRKVALEERLDKSEQQYQQIVAATEELEKEKAMLLEKLKKGKQGQRVFVDDSADVESNSSQISQTSIPVLPNLIILDMAPISSFPNRLKRFGDEMLIDDGSGKRRRAAAPGESDKPTESVAFRVPRVPKSAEVQVAKSIPSPRKTIVSVTKSSINKENLTKRMKPISPPVEPVLQEVSKKTNRKLTFQLDQAAKCRNATPQVKVTYVPSTSGKRKSSSQDSSSAHTSKLPRIEEIPGNQDRSLDLPPAEKHPLRNSTGNSTIGEISKENKEVRRSASPVLEKIPPRKSAFGSQLKQPGGSSFTVAKKFMPKPSKLATESNTVERGLVEQHLEPSQNSPSPPSSNLTIRNKTSSWRPEKNANLSQSQGHIIGSSEPSEEMTKTIFAKKPEILQRSQRNRMLFSSSAHSSNASPANLQKDSGKKEKMADVIAEPDGSVEDDENEDNVGDASTITEGDSSMNASNAFEMVSDN